MAKQLYIVNSKVNVAEGVCIFKEIYLSDSKGQGRN